MPIGVLATVCVTRVVAKMGNQFDKTSPKLHAPQAPKAEIWMIIVGVCVMFRNISNDISSKTESITLQKWTPFAGKMLKNQSWLQSILKECPMFSR